ncbi:mediator of RNA polymerase ii transcription subunit 13 [Plakobranchus ocellatus]|uniref:Mediator of RNA polymerase II transcription subunit 13 n=1 Tax=Plakobranchus ocellatus TaxID=259542 RepID=A0AAV4ATX7_9GAST|nr:mediator of RNA polymerase ii transcription subunit 13 [Plakobranchus ocellatus]
MLTGVTYSDNDHISPATKMFEEWAGYYPVKDSSASGASGASILGDSGLGRDDCSSMGASGGLFGSSLGGSNVGCGGGVGGHSKVPNMVEVIVGNTRMAYPSCYVLVCDGDEMSGSSVLQPMHHHQHAQHQHSHTLQLTNVGAGTGRPLGRSVSQLSPPPSPMDSSMLIDASQTLSNHGNPQQQQHQQSGHHQHPGLKALGLPGSVMGSSGPNLGLAASNAGSDTMPFISSSKADVVGYQLAEKVRQDACLNTSPTKRLQEANGNDEQLTSQQQQQQQVQPSPVGVWNFTDPAGKVNCNCVRHRKKLQGKSILGKHGKSDKVEKLDRRLSRNSVPFHRRSPQMDDFLQFDVDRMMTQPSQQHLQQQQQQLNPAFCPTGGVTTSSTAGSVQGTAVPTQGGRSSTPIMSGSGGEVPTMDTPNSAPSPLDEPTAQQPSGSSSSMDPTMPTLSPHPPSKFGTDPSTGKGVGLGGSTAASTTTNTGDSGQPSSLSVGTPTACVNNINNGLVGGINLTSNGSSNGNGSSAPTSLSCGVGSNNSNAITTTTLSGTTSLAVPGMAGTINMNNSNMTTSTTTSTSTNVNIPTNGTLTLSSQAEVPNKLDDPAMAASLGATCKNSASVSNLPPPAAPAIGPGAGISEPPQQFSWRSVTTKTESISHWVNSHQQRHHQVTDRQHHQTESRQFDTNLKRPNLPTKGSDSDSEQGMDSLYDFDSLNNWINLPLKKGRFESLGDSFSGDLIIASSSFACHSRSVPILPSPSPPHPDPYEFSDEASKDPKTLTTRSRPSRDDMSRPSPIGKMDDDSRPPSCQGNTDINIKEEVGNDLQLASPLTPGGSLTRERDIRVMGTLQDLQQIFQSDSSSDDEDDDAAAIDSGVGSKLSDDLRATRIPNGNMNTITPLDLGRMYPTPPSHETNKSHSPETMTDVTTEGILTTAANTGTNFHSTVEKLAPPIVDTISSVKCDVFIPPVVAETVGAAKYSAVDLPSGRLSPLSAPPEYKSNWSFVLPSMDAQQSQRGHYVNLPSVENISSIRTQGSGIDASPAIPYSNSQQRTPLSYELTSPASNSSSYLKTNYSIDNHGTNSQLPEANSLLLNVLLSDSILNLFKDHNFDSCTICVCNADINGSDVSVYLPDNSKTSSSGFKCTCAFSAAVNRRFGYDSGLFYEDEIEITNHRHDRYDLRKLPLTAPSSQLERSNKSGMADTSGKTEDITEPVMNHLLSQYGSPFLSCIGSHHMNNLQMAMDMCYQPTSVDMLQIRDANDVVSQALDVARQAMDPCMSSRFEDQLIRINAMHKWPYLRGPSCIPNNSQDIISCLKSLHPILQEAIQNKRVTRLWENTYKLQGPISWKDFHDLAGRGTEENHEPQPIPQLLVGHDKDWLSVSPYSIRFWDKQFLEPYGRMRDVLYVVVAPDNDFILQHVVSFFKELSTVYETCRLGRHCAINKPLRDGVLRVGKQAAAKLVDEPVEDWFNLIGDSPLASKLKLYAQVCKHNLGPILCQPNLDKTMFDQGSGSSHRVNQFKMPEPASTNMAGGSSSVRPSTPDSQMSPNTGSQGSQQGEDGKDGQGDSNSKDGAHGESSESPDSDDYNPDAPGIVIYLVDPFSYGQDGGEAGGSISRLAMVGLLRCYQQMMLPDHLANNLNLQLVPLRTILEHKETATKLQTLKSIAFSVFTSCKWNLSHAITGRPLTGFGPAAAAEHYLKKKEGDIMKLYSPPFVLASTKNRQNQIMETKCDQSTVIFCGYCLSEDQRWLLAVCTDDKGELMEHTVINIEIPNRNRRKKASARRPGLQKLWDFILGVVSLTCLPSRLVIGRFGRMGHGELKGWSALLNKKNIQTSSRRLKEMCNQCSVMGPSEMPCVLSVCLVSMETHPSFQVIVDALKQEEKQSSSIPLQTPRDASVTHILVFPTSATAQVNSNPLQQDPQNDFGGNLLDDVLQDFNSMGEDNFIFAIFEDNVNFDAPNASPPGSPINSTNRQNSRQLGPLITWTEPLSDPKDLLQQPLAMGYYISTAPPGPLPKWFWSACPENEFSSPHVFKSALHIHESSRHDDLLHKSDNKNKLHALDSHMTCDVLRYVLENYNSLSWLTFDPVLNDRRSCLPVHFVVLMQLYHALNAFV